LASLDKEYREKYNCKLRNVGYEAAKELKAQEKVISCWYLNTARRRVEVLVGEPRNSLQDEALFRISIEQYATVHNKILRNNSREDTLPPEKERLEFAQFLVASPAYIRALRKLLVEKDKGDPAVESVHYQISRQNKEQGFYTCERPLDSDEKAVLKMAGNCDLIQDLNPTENSLSFKISSQQFLFLNGGWLELYVQSEIANIKENEQPLFEDIGRNRLVHNKTEQGYNKEKENELDVSMIYNAQLFIVECKAGSEVKKSETIFKLDSVANAFGGGFVGKYLVTALSKNEIEKLGNNSQKEKSNFQERLEIRKIVLITLDDLTKLGNFFKKEAKTPTYSRI
jgi:hypothetical protein